MNKKQNPTRIPFYVESERGDDALGTNQDGKVVSDHEASQKGEPFEAGIPQENIQEAVEGQLKDDKWVTVTKKSGESELLTKKDIPAVNADDDWRKAFAVLPPKPKEEPKKTEPPAAKEPKDQKKSAEKITTPAPAKKTCGNSDQPKKPTEVWESKFKDIGSATAMHKVKPG